MGRERKKRNGESVGEEDTEAREWLYTVGGAGVCVCMCIRRAIQVIRAIGFPALAVEEEG